MNDYTLFEGYICAACGTLYKCILIQVSLVCFAVFGLFADCGELASKKFVDHNADDRKYQ